MQKLKSIAQSVQKNKIQIIERIQKHSNNASNVNSIFIEFVSAMTPCFAVNVL